MCFPLTLFGRCYKTLSSDLPRPCRGPSTAQEFFVWGTRARSVYSVQYESRKTNDDSVAAISCYECGSMYDGTNFLGIKNFQQCQARKQWTFLWPLQYSSMVPRLSAVFRIRDLHGEGQGHVSEGVPDGGHVLLLPQGVHEHRLLGTWVKLFLRYRVSGKSRYVGSRQRNWT